MARTARIVVPGHPHHVVHRGHNRQPVFLRPGDHEAYLEDLRRHTRRYGVDVLAFCLMTNHVHVLLVPPDADTLACTMHRLAAGHARRINRRSGRIGALWQGRYYSSVVDRDAYLLACARYIELNPTRAGLVTNPLDYRWSSAAERCALRASSGVLNDRAGLLSELPRGARAYAAFLARATDAETVVIRATVRSGRPTGPAAFAERMAAQSASTANLSPANLSRSNLSPPNLSPA